MLSAFGLLMSERLHPQRFWQYYTKRIVRIYPVVWSNVLLLLLPLSIFYYFTASPAMFLHYFGDPLRSIEMIYYPPHWFLQALMFFYLVGFFFLKNYSAKKILWAYMILTIVYVFAYSQFEDFTPLIIEQTIGFKMIFYAMVFLLGIYFADINEKIAYRGFRDYVMLIGIISLIYAHKILWMKGIGTEYQFVQQLLIFPMLYYFMKISKSPFILEKIMGHKKLSVFITLIGAMSLELYIVHGSIRPFFVKYIPSFPENVIVYLLVVFLVSYLFYRLNLVLVDKIKKSFVC